MTLASDIVKPEFGAPLDTEHPLFPAAGCWSLNEGGGSVAHDASGRRHNGSLVNISPATDWVQKGWLGACLDLTSSTAYLNMGTIQMQGWTGCTHAVWFRPASLANNQVLYQGGGGSYARLWLDPTDGYAHLSYWGMSGGNTTLWNQSLDSMSIGEWYYFVATYDAGSGVSLYQNGRRVMGPSTPRGAFTSASTGDLIIGAQTASYRAINGYLGDISIFPRALNAAEVAALYADPWVAWRPRRRVARVVSTGGGPSFQPAWAMNSTLVTA